jgi:hypothetical protein
VPAVDGVSEPAQFGYVGVRAELVEDDQSAAGVGEIHGRIDVAQEFLRDPRGADLAGRGCPPTAW